MKPDDKQYLDEVLASPDDNAPRLRWAKELRRRGDPRGEFIEVQIARHHEEQQQGREMPRSARERALLDRHGDEWRKPFDVYWKGQSDLPHRFEIFDRGFVTLIDRIRGEEFVVDAPRLFALAPIQHANVAVKREYLPAFLASPWVKRLRSLDMHGNSFTDDDVELIAGERHLEGLRWLDLSSNKIGERGVEALIASPYLANADIIRLNENPCDPVEKGGYYPGEQDDWIVHVDYVPLAEKLEAKYGYRPWLHVRWKKAWQAPRRFLTGARSLGNPPP